MNCQVDKQQEHESPCGGLTWPTIRQPLWWIFSDWTENAHQISSSTPLLGWTGKRNYDKRLNYGQGETSHDLMS